MMRAWKRSPDSSSASGFYSFAVWALRLYARLVYGLHVYGSEHVPMTGGLIVASNHISSLDPPVMGVAVPREVNYMAKKELFENRYWRTLWLGLRAYPVDRQRSDMGAVKESLRRLGAGTAVGIFIQGTRNQGDAKALGGAAFLAQRAGVPIVPAAIFREGRAYVVRFGAPIIPKGKSREETDALTEEVMNRINALRPSPQRAAGLTREV